RPRENREEDGSQDGDNSDNHEQLDQSEARASFSHFSLLARCRGESESAAAGCSRTPTLSPVSHAACCLWHVVALAPVIWRAGAVVAVVGDRIHVGGGG